MSKISEKKDKRINNRKLRKINKQILSKGNEDFKDMKEVSDRWNMTKDK